ncbi:MAG TPA: hypothetical protein VGX03_36695 [Candidatus Binatia bacterium]|jgi:hypothetical protein|nr:hypothetical protein [Candidatus Binatia bacterium]
MGKEDFAPEDIAALARETAQRVGCQAVRWWQDTVDPRLLYIEVNYTFSDGQPFSVWISARLPGHLVGNRHAEDQGGQPASTTVPNVEKMSRGRRDFRTP